MKNLNEFIRKNLKQTFFAFTLASFIPIIFLIFVIFMITSNYTQAVKDGSEWSDAISQTVDIRRLVHQADKNQSEESAKVQKELFDGMLIQLKTATKTQTQEMQTLITSISSDIQDLNRKKDLTGLFENIGGLEDSALLSLKNDLLKKKESSEQMKQFVTILAILFMLLLIVIGRISKGILSNMLAQQKKIMEQQAQLITQSTFASLGRMAGGVAHEVNNPLTSLLLNVEQIRHVMDMSVEEVHKDKVKTMLALISKNAKRIDVIISGLMVFSRSSNSDPFVITKLSSVIQDTLQFCQQRFVSSGVNLEYKTLPDSVQVWGRATQLAQVFLNLLNNALDAALLTKSGEKYVRLEWVQKNDKLEIHIIDSGPGVPKGLEEEIFKPFFTTRDIGSGTGLGLSIAKGAIEEHGGRIYLDRSSNRTCFVVILPVLSSHEELLMKLTKTEVV